MEDPRVLEIGPGNCLIAKRRPSWKYRAIGPSEEEQGIIRELGYDFIVGTVPESVHLVSHCIIAEHVIEHSKDTRAFATWCYNSLCTEGLLVL